MRVNILTNLKKLSKLYFELNYSVFRFSERQLIRLNYSQNSKLNIFEQKFNFQKTN